MVNPDFSSKVTSALSAGINVPQRCLQKKDYLYTRRISYNPSLETLANTWDSGDAEAVQFWLAPFKMHEDRDKRRNWFFLRPAVHHGFQRSWTANGLNHRVVERVGEIAAEAAAEGRRLQVITTGNCSHDTMMRGLSCARVSGCTRHLLMLKWSTDLPPHSACQTRSLTDLSRKCWSRHKPMFYCDAHVSHVSTGTQVTA